ncbi:hypothetical protein NA56DRAFT_675256 [Hyaloscypha hepaticicola]|uniref:PLC-like phosphodiesterase n=1 Tax=Hyaloscypha hepaticicola TaxID=2082293 RepID=A0A2J6PEF8_9HELO|nr:hypothetical protein NA56DRAFT_675256 [Hyaloscypha hepaticicola]
MGIGSYVLLINATPWSFNLVEQYSHQMSTWDFPAVVENGGSARVYMEDQEGFVNKNDDRAEALYAINNDSDFEFEILYRVGYGPGLGPLLVSYNESFHTISSPTGATLTLDWTQNQDAPFILASLDTDLSSAIFVTSYDRIECLTLRELAMPGSHDSGMSQFNGGRGGASPTNVKTQTLDFGGQLRVGWLGGNGQSIASIIEQVNNFTASNSELIILDLSHGLDTDNFDGDPKNHLTEENWNDLMTVLVQLNYLFNGSDSSRDLSNMSVSDFIGTGPAVVVIVRDKVEGGGNVDLSTSSPHVYCTPVTATVTTVAQAGFFQDSALPVYNNYSDTDRLDVMANDQLQKMLENRQNPESEMFLLSWTLTQSTRDIFNPAFASILDLAAKAKVALWSSLWNKMSSQQYPNVLMVDAFQGNGDVTAMALAINYHFAKICTVPSSFGHTILRTGGF